MELPLDMHISTIKRSHSVLYVAESIAIQIYVNSARAPSGLPTIMIGLDIHPERGHRQFRAV